MPDPVRVAGFLFLAPIYADTLHLHHVHGPLSANA